MTRRQRILDQICDLSVRKQLVMRWYFQNEISASECEELIRKNKLEAA